MITAYFDGGARSNPGPAGYGVHIVDDGGTVVAELHGSLGIATNNVAEYNGLLAALEWASANGVRDVLIRSDSLLLVQRQGMSVPLHIERELKAGGKLRLMPFFPNYILRDVLAWYVALAILAALALFYPWELGNKADPFAAVPPGIKPEWYFLAMFHTLKLLPSHILGFEGERVGVIAYGLIALFLVVVPFLDREPKPGNRVSLAFVVAGWLAIVYMAIATAMVYWPQRG